MDNRVYICECQNEDCEQYVNTEEYEKLRKSEFWKFNGKNTFITLKAHLPAGSTILDETYTLYLRTYRNG